MEWTLEDDVALQELKRYLASPPIRITPKPSEPLLLYVTATSQVVSAVFVARQEEDPNVAKPQVGGSLEQPGQGSPPLEEADKEPSKGSGPMPVKRCLVQRLVYIISMVPRDARLRYSEVQKLLLGVLLTSRNDMGTKEEVKPNFRTPPR
jgi:hypothetical protein